MVQRTVAVAVVINNDIFILWLPDEAIFTSKLKQLNLLWSILECFRKIHILEYFQIRCLVNSLYTIQTLIIL